MTEHRAVIDASALIKLAFHDPLSPAATRIAEHYELLAPSIILSECANALWKAVRFAGYPQAVATLNLTDLQNSLTLLADADLIETAFHLACELEHPVYDCLYLALALQERVPFVLCRSDFFAQTRSSGCCNPPARFA